MNKRLSYQNFSSRLVPREFNSYGSRRGNDAVMARGTFANIRLVNKFIGKAGPKTVHFPSNEEVRHEISVAGCTRQNLATCGLRISH